MENGGDARIYVVGGRTRTPSGISRLHHTTFAFDAGAGRWQKLADISDGRHVMNLSAAPGVALDGRYIAVFGGDNGIVFHEIETLMAERAEAPAGPGKDSLSSVIKDINVHHKGFYKGILLYDTRKDSWSQAGTLPFAAHVTTSAVWWDGRIILADGEIRPGVRTPEVMAAIPRITASGR
jgi:N-acetylneuraminic acid mutarotase